MKEKDRINAILAEAVNEGLSSICSSAASSVLFFLEKNGSIKSASNIGNIKTFAEGLERIFGFGAIVIEKKILEVLQMRLQLPDPKENRNNFEFAKEMGKAIELYEAKITKPKE
ncbi:MAG: hypothetical protein OEY39_07995 [Candidatus Bathyarchaeota archaeon]|nr:hypothetical protein [Candidatus Bathyarchaeota archaeon]MDH5636604.1 hypothetical protein [Candidatus Bathyarchaeota archaeon]